jgi:hypothetical protein
MTLFRFTRFNDSPTFVNSERDELCLVFLTPTGESLKPPGSWVDRYCFAVLLRALVLSMSMVQYSPLISGGA